MVQGIFTLVLQNRTSHCTADLLLVLWCWNYHQIPSIPVKPIFVGSGCDSVGRVVASDSRGQRFESSHWQHFILNIYCQLYWKDENKEKEVGNGPFKKTIFIGSIDKPILNEGWLHSRGFHVTTSKAFAMELPRVQIPATSKTVWSNRAEKLSEPDEDETFKIFPSTNLWSIL